MGRRILAFFLGFIFAFVCIAGAVCIVVFAIKINQVVPQSEPYLGDLSKMSVYDVGQSLYKLYLDKKTWTDENGKYYSLEDFCKHYNIDLTAALGMDLPQEVLDIPAFEYFNEGGLDNAMKQIKVSTLPAIVNMFGGTNEDGESNAMFGETVLNELSQFSMHDLFSDEVGIAGVFANVRFADLLPGSFPAEDSDNKLMWAVGQTKIGGALNGMSGEQSILLQLKAGGAFETVGGLELTAMLGESQYINAILGSGARFADLIDDEGNIRLDDIINGVSIGELLGCQRNEITDTDGYANIAGQDAEAEKQVKQKGEGENILYVMSSNGENWYEAEIDCNVEDDEHVHNTDCFKYVWYATEACGSNHNHEANKDLLKDGEYYARVSGLYAILAAMSITDFTSGNDEALMNQIKHIKISDVIDTSTVSGIMQVFTDYTIEELMNGAVDDMYLGEFFKFTRHAIQDTQAYDSDHVLTVNKERDQAILAYYVITDESGHVALSFNRVDWYEGVMNCTEGDDENHIHHENCYQYNWYQKTDENEDILAEGVQGKLASKQISDLKYLNDEVQKMTLADVFGEDKVPSMLKSISHVEIGKLSEAVNTIHLGELLEYTQELRCENEDEDHEHDSGCYVWIDKNDEVVTGMMAKLAGKQVNEMSDLVDTIKTFTLRDVLGDDGIPDVLKAIADAEIGDLNKAIKKMRVGDFLEYEKRYTCESEDENHEHDENCASAWYDKDGEPVTGMMEKIADKTIDQLNDLDEIVQDLTLRDVLGDNIPQMLLDVADTKISEIGDAVQGIYLGSALNYYRRDMTENRPDYGHRETAKDTLPEIRYKTDSGDKYIMSDDGKTWYEAKLTCKLKTTGQDAHTHDATCYAYAWYEDEKLTTPVDGIVKAFVNCKVGDVSGKMQTVTLGEMGIGGNTILDALQNTPVVEIGEKINHLKMAVVLGYEQYCICNNTDTEHVHGDDCYVWVAECTDHTTAKDHKESDHIIIDGKTCYQPKGLNAKIADKTVEEMTGDSLTDIAFGLTIGELIDSGMISLGDTIVAQTENRYKLSIIYCGNDDHSFNETVTIWGQPVPKTWKCNLSDYLTYSAQKTPPSSFNMTPAEYYYFKCHGKITDTTVSLELSDEEKAHRDAWENLTLKEFVSSFLSAI